MTLRSRLLEIETHGKRIRDLLAWRLIKSISPGHKLTCALSMHALQEVLAEIAQTLEGIHASPIDLEKANARMPPCEIAEAIRSFGAIVQQCEAPTPSIVLTCLARCTAWIDAQGDTWQSSDWAAPTAWTQCPSIGGRPTDIVVDNAFELPRRRSTSEQIHKQIYDVEMCAAEVCAMILFRFALPANIELGLARQCLDEMRHVTSLQGALISNGGYNGQIPVTTHVWDAPRAQRCAADCIALEQVIGEGFSLGADLYHADRYDTAGLSALARLHRAIHIDEINHVRAGLRWFRQLRHTDHAERLAEIELQSSVTPLTDPYFCADLRAFVGFTDDEIQRQRLRAVPP